MPYPSCSAHADAPNTANSTECVVGGNVGAIVGANVGANVLTDVGLFVGLALGDLAYTIFTSTCPEHEEVP